VGSPTASPTSASSASALGGTIAGAILAFADVTALFLTLAVIAAVASGVGLYLGRAAGS